MLRKNRKRKLLYGMQYDLEFDKPITDDMQLYLDSGYFIIALALPCKRIIFDFIDIQWKVDPKDPTIVHVSKTGPDLERYPDMGLHAKSHFTESMMGFEEFFVQFDVLGEDQDVYIVRIKDMSLLFMDSEGEVTS